MRQHTEILNIRVSKETKEYIEILRNRYSINPSHFIRDAIIEKMKRDVKTLRIERDKRLKQDECPF